MSFTVTATASGAGSVAGSTMQVLVLTNAVEAGGGSGAFSNQGTSATIDASVTPAASSSLVVFGLQAYPTTPVVATSNAYYPGGVYDDTSDGSFYVAGHYSGTVTAGTPVTVGSSTSGQYSSVAAYEIKGISGAPVLDGSTPAWVTNQSSQAVTSAAFSPPAGSVLVAIAITDGDDSGTIAIAVSDTSGLGLAWTQRKIATTGTAGSQAAVFTATVPSGTTSTGAMSLNPSMAGAGAEAFASSGSLSMAPMAMAGSGGVPLPVTASGSLSMAPMAMAGAAAVPVSAFPATALGLTAELQVNGTWTDVSAFMDHGPVVIGRGHPDESTTVSPSTLAMTLTNTTGEFTSQNPVSALYPWLKPNIPLRVSFPAASTYLRSEVDSASGASCPDAAGLHVTGDIDIRLDVALTDYGNHDLIFKWGAAGNFGWFLQLANGAPQFFWSTTGSDEPSATSTAPLPFGRLTLRVTLQVSTGTVTFWTGPAGNADSNTGWTQLGSAFAAGSTSIHASTAVIETGGWYGSVYEAEVRSGIGGTVVAHPVFSAQTAGATSFTDAESNTWTLSGTAELSARNYRGHFEVPEFSQQEPEYQPDEGAPEPDVLCAIAGGGLLRRLGAANTPLQSPMRRAYVKLSTTAVAAAPVDYWHMEDGAAATQLASGLGGQPMYFAGAPQLASSTAFACSSALPVANGASFAGRVRAASWTSNVVRFLMEVPAAGEANGAVIAQVYTTGTVALLSLRYGTGGTLTLTGFDATGAQLFTTGASAFAVNGTLLRVSMELQPQGSGIQYAIASLAPGAPTASDLAGTLATSSVGAVTQVLLNPNGTLTGTVFGHCSVQAVWDSLADLGGALTAWLAEPAGTRFARLCGEEGIQFRGRGQMAATTLMGIQGIQTLTQLLQECADADRGLWTELRQQLGWGYVTRAALYNQPAALTLDHDQDHLSPWASDPAQDDQQLLNDATITATAGSSARAFAAPGQPVTGGRLSNLPPPAGIGVYDSVPTSSVNTYRDGDLAQIVSWMIHIGTADVQRFPGILIDLANTAYPYFAATVAMDLGDRLVMVNPPPWLGADPVSQLCQGLTETMWAYDYTIEVNGVPETPYEVAQAGVSHAGTAGSQVNAAYAYGAATMSVATTAGSLWTTSAGDFPFSVMASGMELTVTSITGSSSPQTFSVTPGVNGVQKNLAAGTAVQVCTRPVAGL